jgi:hypothetical protein
MEDCWNEVPNYRPRLDLLVRSLGEMFGERSTTSVSLTDVKVYKVHKSFTCVGTVVSVKTLQNTLLEISRSLQAREDSNSR